MSIPESARELRERETDALVANLREAIKDRKMPIRLSVADTRAILDRLDTSAPADVGELIERLRYFDETPLFVMSNELGVWLAGNAALREEAADALARLSRAPDGPEPVAWRWFDRASEGYDYIDNHRGDYDAYRGPYHRDQFTPLYTHPAPDGPAPAVSEAEVEAALKAQWQAERMGHMNQHDAMRFALEEAQRARK